LTRSLIRAYSDVMANTNRPVWRPTYGTTQVGFVTVNVDDNEGRPQLLVPRILMHVRCVECQDAWPVSDGEIDRDSYDALGEGFDVSTIECSSCGAKYEIEVP
jgi:hypothetical protein